MFQMLDPHDLQAPKRCSGRLFTHNLAHRGSISLPREVPKRRLEALPHCAHAAGSKQDEVGAWICCRVCTTSCILEYSKQVFVFRDIVSIAVDYVSSERCQLFYSKRQYLKGFVSTSYLSEELQPPAALCVHAIQSIGIQQDFELLTRRVLYCINPNSLLFCAIAISRCFSLHIVLPISWQRW